MINIEFYSNHLEATISPELEGCITDALRLLGINNSTLELEYVSSDEIMDYNKKYRHHNKPTDVLSFPQPVIPGAKDRQLGSIIICPEVVSVKQEEMCDVVRHGILHLLGFDHETNLPAWDKAASIINCGL